MLEKAVKIKDSEIRTLNEKILEMKQFRQVQEIDGADMEDTISETDESIEFI